MALRIRIPQAQENFKHTAIRVKKRCKDGVIIQKDLHIVLKRHIIRYGRVQFNYMSF